MNSWLVFDLATFAVGFGLGAGAMWYAKSPDQVKEDIQILKDDVQKIKALVPGSSS